MRVRVPNVLAMLPCCYWLAGCAAQRSPYRSPAHGSYRTPSVYDPLEVVDFELITEPARMRGGNSALAPSYNARNFNGRNKYELVAEPEPRVVSSGWSRNRLPLLSRGERDLEEEEEEYSLEEEEEEPSCAELRRMWRIARRIHNKAIRTNKIPQEEVHPFSQFESDRFRAGRRIKNRKNRNKNNKLREPSSFRPTNEGQGSKGSSQGAKEVPSQDLNYGSVQRYSSSLTDQVKRPRDPVRQVYDRLKGDAAGGDNVNYNSKPVGGDSTAGSSKDGGAWATGVRHFEKSPPKASSFESLHSELRKSKGLSALAPKDTSSPTWGEMRFFQEKPKQTSPLDLLRDRMQKEDVWQRSRLNYRDEESGSIPPAQQDAWQGKKSLKKKEKNKKKIAQLEQDLLRGFRGEDDRQDEVASAWT